jgi:small subunit ribosomal protein S11
LEYIMSEEKDIKVEVPEAVEEAKAPETVEATETVAETAAETAEVKKQRSKSGRYVPAGIAFVHATFNNTKVTFTDLHGNVLCWSTGGKNGFKGSRKSTAYAAQVIAGDAAKRAQTLGMKEVEVRIKGPGAGRESAVRGIAAAGLEINAIKDITPVPHNGCRPPKRRRI